VIQLPADVGRERFTLSVRPEAITLGEASRSLENHYAATVVEVGSGLNGNRVKLRKLLADPAVATIVVEHRDRPARFGVEHLEAALSATGRRIIVLNPDEVKDDLVGDMVEVLTSMCARLYGRRSARKRADAAVKAAAVAE